MQKYTRAFRVRHYECDAYGHVNNAQYLRWMQETAMDASAAVGYDEAAYLGLGTLWLIRESQIEYLNALRYGDRIEVHTWVGDFRRVRSRRYYEVQRLADSAEPVLVARGFSDWVYLDRTTQRPVSIPPEMIAAFRPYSALDESDAQAVQRDPFPEPPPPPSGAHTWTHRVEWRDLDAAGHVNNATYLNFLEECGVRAAEALGWPMIRMKEENMAIMARSHRIEYLNQATLGDLLHVTTYLDEIRRSTAIRHYTIRRDDGTLVGRSRSQFMFVNIASGSLLRIKPEWVESFAPQTAGYQGTDTP